MFRFGMGELVVVFLIIVLLFGAKRLPELAKSMGKSLREFRNAGKEVKESVEIATKEIKDGIEFAANEEDEKKKEDETNKV